MDLALPIYVYTSVIGIAPRVNKFTHRDDDGDISVTVHVLQQVHRVAADLLLRSLVIFDVQSITYAECAPKSKVSKRSEQIGARGSSWAALTVLKVFLSRRQTARYSRATCVWREIGSKRERQRERRQMPEREGERERCMSNAVYERKRQTRRFMCVCA